nr:uncharacterized protein LOC131139463 isoform X2 [Doryrhamphus excisus]
MAVDNPANQLWRLSPLGYIIGIQFILCGILYIITEHNPTKKTVTASLALGIVAIVGAFWMIFILLTNIEHHYYHRDFDYFEFDNMTLIEEDTWRSQAVVLGLATEAIFVFYAIVGTIILLVMSVLAGAALRSTKSQATVVMSTTTTETPAH